MNTPQTDRYGFPVVPCTRCTGTGAHGPRSVRSGVCFKCNGQGIHHKGGKAAKAAAEFYTDRRNARRASAAGVGDIQALQPGDVAAHGTVNGRVRAEDWVTIVSVTKTDRESGWSTVGVEGTPGYTKTIHYEYDVVVTDAAGDTRTIHDAGYLWFLKNPRPIDPAPYLAAAGIKAP